MNSICDLDLLLGTRLDSRIHIIVLIATLVHTTLPPVIDTLIDNFIIRILKVALHELMLSCRLISDLSTLLPTLLYL